MRKVKVKVKTRRQKKNIRLNVVIKEKAVGYKTYTYKSHGGVVALLFLLICLIPDVPINLVQSLIIAPFVIIGWDVLTYLLFIAWINSKHKKNAQNSDHMRE